MESKKQRGENWSAEEKELLRQIIRQSLHIVENKCTKINVNTEKTKEWKYITNKFNKLSGKTRSYWQVKLAWKRMKLTDKANISAQKQQCTTGDGEKPPSPTQEDLIDVVKHEFIDSNNYDSDAVQPMFNSSQQETVNPITASVDPIIITDQITPTKQDTPRKSPQRDKKNKHNLQNTASIREAIADSNIAYKRRHLEMLEIEHEYNIKISKLKIKKLELQIQSLKHNL